jgi:hypothetical protein
MEDDMSSSQLEWRQHKANEWWLVFKIAPPSLRDGNGVQYPPLITATTEGPKDCIHLYSYSNGEWPDAVDPKDDDIDYIHICDLDDFIQELQDLREALINNERS